jgi:beta-glucosidase/6-phospho-beta-glucosidase/beta-galactosidase
MDDPIINICASSEESSLPSTLPSQSHRVEQMRAIHSTALELFTRKNTDYGDAFAEFGLIGVLMRIEDKIKRSLSITKNGINLVNDESIRDTLLDLHNYAAMALMLLNE